MPRVKVTSDELDINALEDAEYNEDDFDTYSGQLPETDTILTGYIKSMWWTMTKNNDRMFKVLFIAADNEEDEAEFDGLPIWDNPFFSPAGKFRWKPFIDNFDLTLTDVQKKLYLVSSNPEDDHPTFGAPVQKVGTLVPGGDTAWARVLTKIGFDQNGERRVEVKKWLPLEDEDEVVDEEEPDEDQQEEPEDEEDTPEDDDEYDEDDEDDEDEEDEEEDEDEDDEPEPPAKGRGRRPAPKAATKAAPARIKTAAKAAPARGGRPSGRTATTGSRQASTRTSKTATKAAPARGRRTAKADAEPPF
jgi:hypothetical protein